MKDGKKNRKSQKIDKNRFANLLKQEDRERERGLFICTDKEYLEEAEFYLSGKSTIGWPSYVKERI